MELPAAADTVPLRVGVNRSANLPSSAPGERFRNSDGTQVLVFAIRSPGAVALRVQFAGFAIAPGDEVFVRGAGEKQANDEPYRGKGPGGDGEFWAATVDGDTAVIEYHKKSADGSFVISGVSHIFKIAVSDNTPDVLSCQVDASCSSVGAKSAVARISFIRGGASYVCSGTMITNANYDRTPYFLTANHCISTPIRGSLRRGVLALPDEFLQ